MGLKRERAYAKREYRRFLRAIGLRHGIREDREKAMHIVTAMQETARRRGMSEYEMATTYDADALLAIYREALTGATEDLDLVWWLSHWEPLVLMASRTHWTRAWHAYVVLPRGQEPT